MAAKKKDFTAINTNPVFQTISEATADPTEQLPGQMELNGDGETRVAVTEPRKERTTYTQEEKDEFLSTLRTGGRKGCKLPRINVAFSPENYDYIRAISKENGVTMTELINKIISANLERNRERYEQIKNNRKEFIV